MVPYEYGWCTWVKGGGWEKVVVVVVVVVVMVVMVVSLIYFYSSLSLNQKSALFPQVVLTHLDDGKEGDKEESACPPFELLISWGPYNCFSFFSLSARTAIFFICFR